MTDRHSGYIITLDKDIREDDAESLIKLLYLIDGVISVEPVGTSPMDIHVARMRIKNEFWELAKEFFFK